MKKMFLILPLLIFLSVGSMGCGLFHKDDPDENFWEEAESAPAPSSRPSKETQEKIDIIKSRLIRYFGYNEVSAADVLNYVASIFARGDAKD